MLLHGRFEDENGVKYYVPARPNMQLPERQVVETAREMAAAKGVRVVRVWAVYETEEQLPL